MCQTGLKLLFVLLQQALLLLDSDHQVTAISIYYDSFYSCFISGITAACRAQSPGNNPVGKTVIRPL